MTEPQEGNHFITGCFHFQSVDGVQQEAPGAPVQLGLPLQTAMPPRRRVGGGRADQGRGLCRIREYRISFNGSAASLDQ